MYTCIQYRHTNVIKNIFIRSFTIRRSSYNGYKLLSLSQKVDNWGNTLTLEYWEAKLGLRKNSLGAVKAWNMLTPELELHYHASGFAARFACIGWSIRSLCHFHYLGDESSRYHAYMGDKILPNQPVNQLHSGICRISFSCQNLALNTLQSACILMTATKKAISVETRTRLIR